MQIYHPRTPIEHRALRHGTTVRTNYGWTPVEHIQVGSHILTPEGAYCTAINVYPQGERPLIRITFADDRYIDCDEQHLWEVHSYNFYKKRKYKKQMTARVISALELYETIANKGTYSKKHYKNYYIPLVYPEELDASYLPIPPYTLGCILGSLGNRNIVKIYALEKSVLQRVKEDIGPDYHVEIRSYNVCNTGVITPLDSYTTRTPSYTKLLRDMHLLNIAPKDIFIPSYYINGSIEQRIELLKGIMDTCGYTNKFGTFKLYHVSEQLIRDMATIIYSLGGIAYRKENQIRYRLLEERMVSERCTCLNIRLRDPSIIMTRYIRGTENIEDFEPNDKLKLLIKEVEKIEPDQATCIEVDHPEQLYVIKDYIVTHNAKVVK